MINCECLGLMPQAQAVIEIYLTIRKEITDE